MTTNEESVTTIYKDGKLIGLMVRLEGAVMGMYKIVPMSQIEIKSMIEEKKLEE